MTGQYNQKEVIAVLGATGTIGSALVMQLAELGHAVRVATRDPARAAKFGGQVEVVTADLEQPETLAAAFAGASKAFTLSNGPAIALEARAFAAAKAAGVTHIVRVSAQEIEFPDVARTSSGQAQIGNDETLRDCGIDWTVLRPSFFSSNVLIAPFLFDLRLGTSLPTGGGREAPIDPHDIAAVAVKALTTPGHENKTYVLTGPELLSYAEMTAKLSAATARPLRHQEATEAETHSRLLGAGVPAAFAEVLLAHFAAVRAGRIYLTSTVAGLLGRPARSFDDWLAGNSGPLTARVRS